MVRFGIPGQNNDPLAYVDSRLSSVPMIQAPRRPTVDDKKWPMWTEWRVNKNASLPAVEGEFWKLIRFESNGDATWVQIDTGSGGPGVDYLRDQVNAQVTPDSTGNIDLDGVVVANGSNPSAIPLETVAGTNKIDFQIQVATARTGSPSDKNDTGLCSFDDTAFSVDANGYVTLIGGAGPAIDSIDIDFNTSPGTDPVVPNGSGQLSIYGNTVANGTNTNAPVATHSRAANQLQVDVQLATALSSTPADFYDVGLSSYDSVYFSADSNGFVSFKNSTVLNTRPGDTINLGISYSSGTFTIHGADGTALSSSNPAWVTCPMNTEGLTKVYKITSNITWQDSAGTSDIIGNTFGLTSGDDWGSNDIPFFIYVCGNQTDTDCKFFVSRSPGRQTMDAAGSIGYPGTANATTQGRFWCMETITPADYASNTAAICGCFRMRTSQPGDDWTVQAISTADGMGKFFQPFSFAFPTGVFGASSGTYLLDNGGTAPIFVTNSYRYTFIDFNNLKIDILLESDGGTDGAGAVNTRITTPFQVTASHIGNAGCFRVTTPTFDHGAIGSTASNINYFSLDDLTDGTKIQNGDFTNGTRKISGQMSIFLSSG